MVQVLRFCKNKAMWATSDVERYIQGLCLAKQVNTHQTEAVSSKRGRFVFLMNDSSLCKKPRLEPHRCGKYRPLTPPRPDGVLSDWYPRGG